VYHTVIINQRDKLRFLQSYPQHLKYKYFQLLISLTNTQR